jgi:hypothetical protein
MRASRLFLIVLAAGALTGCELPFVGGVCTADFRFGVVVEVRDAVTGAPAADGARLTVRDGEYVETTEARVPSPDALFLQGAGERAGTYDVTVQKSGYQDWTRTGVRVREDECHVIPVQLDARLQPAP